MEMMESCPLAAMVVVREGNEDNQSSSTHSSSEVRSHPSLEDNLPHSESLSDPFDVQKINDPTLVLFIFGTDRPWASPYPSLVREFPHVLC